jgi:hypothetical protein
MPRPGWTALLAHVSARLASADSTPLVNTRRSALGHPSKGGSGSAVHPTGAGGKIPQLAASCLFGRTWARPEAHPRPRKAPMHAPTHTCT